MKKRNQELLSGINPKKGIRAEPIIQKDLELSSIVSKVVVSNKNKNYGRSGDIKENLINTGIFDSESDVMKRRMEDNEDIIKLFPDVKLAMQMVVSSILSPKDMVKSETLYKVKGGRLPMPIADRVLKLTKEIMNDEYKLDDSHSTYLKESLFEYGSYIKIVLPENILDEIINGSNISKESYNNNIDKISENDFCNIGILGSNESQVTRSNIKVTLEKLRGGHENHKKVSGFSLMRNGQPILENLISISDNFNYLRLNKLTDLAAKNKLSVALESAKMTSKAFNNILMKEQNNNFDPLQIVPNSDSAIRKSIGKGLVMKIPSEACIPVFTPGDPKDHVGYFLLLDEDGNFVVHDETKDHFSKDTYNISNDGMSDIITSSMIDRAAGNLTGFDQTNAKNNIKAQIYGQLLENDLSEKIQRGLYGKKFDVGMSDRLKRVMLARAMSNRFTRMLFMPAEYVSYMAFNYNKNGTGKSMLDEVRVISGMRAIILFADIMSSVKSSINLTDVKITFDPEDPDPQQTAEMALHNIARMRQNYMPLGAHDVTVLNDWMQRAGLMVSYEGHPEMPETKIDFEVKNLQHTKPDSDLDEKLEKRMWMAFSLTPENVLNGQNAEFATTIIHNNILFSKRIIQYQKDYIAMLNKLVRLILRHDIKYKKEVINILKENAALYEKTLDEEQKKLKRQYYGDNDKFVITEDDIENVIDSIETYLPSPDETTLTNQTAAFQEFDEAVDKVLEYHMSSGALPASLVGEMNGKLDEMKTAVKAVLMRDWQIENNYLPQLSDLSASDEDGKPRVDVYDRIKEHGGGIVKSLLKLFQATKAAALAANNDLNKVSLDNTESTSIDSSGSDVNDDSAEETTDSDESPEPEGEHAEKADDMVDGGNLNAKLF